MTALLPLPTTAAPVLPALLDTSPDDLAAWFADRDQPPMRARQVRRWLLAGRAESFAAMSDLPKGLRDELAAAFRPFGSTVEKDVRSLDGTRKLLLRLADGQRTECVMIPEMDRNTACVSTQVGCGMGCVFCASGVNGVARNLSAGEILEQLVRVRNLTPAGQRLSNVVVMGMGEPLANLDNLLAALAVAGRPDGLNIGARHVTISTVGLPAKMRQLAESGRQYHLAVSLHAPNDPLRTEIVPTNRKTGIAAILAAADDFFRRTGRRVTYEYVLLGGVNDQPPHAHQLADLLRGREAFVNVIPWNDVTGMTFRRPRESDQVGFLGVLRAAGVNVQVRKRKGADIDAACGQLRRAEETRGTNHRGPESTEGRHTEENRPG